MARTGVASDDQRRLASTPSIDEIIAENAQALSSQLATLRSRLFPPQSQKVLRRFSSGEAARLLSISDGYLRQLSLAGEVAEPEKGAGGRRLYTLAQIHDIRQALARAKPAYSQQRQRAEHLQIIAVCNFKGGSGKTTSSVHLAQHLAMRGYRTLAVDLDPQASMSGLLGYQPEFDIAPNSTLYGAIRYDGERRPLSEIVRKTYFPGLDLVPANLELHEWEHDTPKILADRKTADDLFFGRVASAIHSVGDDYDVVVIDCPPQLGFLTLSALCAATGVLITVHPQMLDLASMNQFLHMASSLLSVVRKAGGDLRYDYLRYLITRFEPHDAPQSQVVAFIRHLFGDLVLTNAMLKSTALSDSGMLKQTLYEVSREQLHRATYDRALESLNAVNGEIEALVRKAWGRPT